MQPAQIEQRADGMIVVRGPLKFNTVKALCHSIDFSQHSGRQVRVNLSEVDGIDSAGVALCVDWVSQAAKEGAQIVFQKAPDQMLRLASMNQLENLFADTGSSYAE